ncbi:MAG: septum formation family protein [Jiangellaceae bacterium]
MAGRAYPVTVGLVVLAAACSGGDDAAGPGTEAAAASTAAAAPTERPATSAPPTTLGRPTGDLMAALNATFGESIGSAGFVEPDGPCFAAAIEGLPPDAADAVDGLVQDRVTFDDLSDEDAGAVAAAYVGCVEPDVLRNFLVISTTRAVDQLSCISDAWTDVVRPEAVASSLAFGHGLDDLLPDVVEEMSAATVACVPDPEWWIEDEAFLLTQNGVEAETASCVASAVIAEHGVDPVVTRRILTLDFVPLDEKAFAELDLPGQCALQPPPITQLSAEPGDCLAGFGGGTAATGVIVCDQPHNAEVVSVKDLSAVLDTWPGARVLRSAAEQQCATDVEALSGDLTGYMAGWDVPGRTAWEQGARSLTCALVQPDYATWTGPSGLVPETPSTTMAQAPTTRAPTATTLPPGAREVLSVDEIDRPGTCIYRAPARPGQDDLERRSFEVDCSVPHQAEMYHRFDVEAQAGAPYPGDSAVQAQSDPVCKLTFASYVGVPWESSRLQYVYFYPSEETWSAGDRTVVCFLVGAQADEEFTRSMAASRE